MANLDDAVNSLLPVINSRQPRVRSWLATAGDGHGTVIDTSTPNHIFVRVLNNAVGTAPAVQTISVFNDVSLLADGDRCVIGFGPERPRLLRVLAKQDQRYDTTSDGTIIIGGSNQGVLPHGWQHAWLAPDPVFIDFFQVINLAVYPAGGLSVAIQRGIIPRTGVDTLVDNQTLDLTSHVPASGALWALLSVAADGTIAVTLSANIGSRIALDYTSIPDTPAGNFRLAAVALYEEQTEIILSKTQQDIFDLRWPQETGTGGTSGGAFSSIYYLSVGTSVNPFIIGTLTALPDGIGGGFSIPATTSSDIIMSLITGFPIGTALLASGIVSVLLNAYKVDASPVVKLFYKLYTALPNGSGWFNFTLLATSALSDPLTTSLANYRIAAILPETPIDPTSRIYLELYSDLVSGSATNTTLSFSGDTTTRLTLPSGSSGGGADSIPLVDSHILVGNISGIATDVAMSKAATIDDTGAVEITAHAIIEMQVFGG